MVKYNKNFLKNPWLNTTSLVFIILAGFILSSAQAGPTPHKNKVGNKTSAKSEPCLQEATNTQHPGKRCESKANLSTYMGSYKVFAVSKYGGGLTSKHSAMEKVGHIMITLTPKKVAVSGNKTIKKPAYKLTCFPPPTEGEVVPKSHWHSNFYGYGNNRKTITVLTASIKDSKNVTPYYKFELITKKSPLEIWYMSDGWIYKLKKQDNKTMHTQHKTLRPRRQSNQRDENIIHIPVDN